MQSTDGKEFHPVSYASRVLRSAERNYSTADRECLAIIFAVSKFRPYIEGRKFEVMTDNCALCYLQSKNKLPPRLMRYTMLLQEFDFKIIYKSGKQYLDVNCLSRNPIICSSQQNEQKLERRKSQLARAQLDDPYCKSMIDKLTNLNNLSNRAQRRLAKFVLKDDYLFRKVRTIQGDKLKLVVPEKEQLGIIKQFHDSTLSGHPGSERTYHTILAHYNWPRMSKHIRNYVKTCVICQKTKEDPVKPHGSLQPISTKAPFEKIGIDFLGPLNPTSKNSKYILVCTDLFTRWVETESTKNCTANTVARFLITRIFLKHGSPDMIITDRGTHFNNELVSQLIRNLESKHAVSTAYHPQTNGACERVNYTLSQILSSIVFEKPEEWET